MVAHSLGRDTDLVWLLPVVNDALALEIGSASLPVVLLAAFIGLVGLGGYTVCSALKGRLAAWVPGLLIGGAIGNLVDRLLFGAVRDFLVTPIGIMNLADLALLLGTRRGRLVLLAGNWRRIPF